MESAVSQTFLTGWALLPDGWHRDVRLVVDNGGIITSVEPKSRPAPSDVYCPILVPGMINLHSHAFQRRLVGRTHRFQRPDDDFWSWRTEMYQFAGQVDAAGLESQAGTLYHDMLDRGYTTVCEFHYTHSVTHPEDLESALSTSQAIFAAAHKAGIRLVHLPVLYQFAGFGERPPAAEQTPFILATNTYLDLIDELRRSVADRENQSLGYAPHSLRAVSEEGFLAIEKHRDRTDSDAVTHVHVSEQMREVNECLLALGKRPVQWVMEHLDPDERWCLIHATHTTDSERQSIARSGATVGLCPTTEADLGDGQFAVRDFLKVGGRFGIGSDSNVCLEPAEELRLLDYQNRLTSRRRNAFGLDGSRSAGTVLYLAACEGGRRASGQPVGRIETGSRADLVSLDPMADLTRGASGEQALDAFVYSLGSALIDRVFVGGRMTGGRKAAHF